jgi:hypothetical protein
LKQLYLFKYGPRIHEGWPGIPGLPFFSNMKFRFNTYNFLIAAAFLLFSFSLSAEKLSEGDVDGQNYISIQGSSNINEFQLINPYPALDETNSGIEGNERYRNIRIPVDEFTLENQRLVHDFRQMVQESKYPYIKIGIERMELADFEETSGLTNFSTIITIAGVSKEYSVPCEVFSKLNSGYTLSGSFSIKLTDFNIDPPEKLMGLIKVNNEVFVNFLFNFDSEEVLTKK